MSYMTIEDQQVAERGSMGAHSTAGVRGGPARQMNHVIDYTSVYGARANESCQREHAENKSR